MCVLLMSGDDLYRRFGSVKGTGARWHPARAIHQYRGEMLVWMYGMVLLDAMFHVEKEIAASSETAVIARMSLLFS